MLIRSLVTFPIAEKRNVLTFYKFIKEDTYATREKLKFEYS